MFRSSYLSLQPVDFSDEFLNFSTTSTAKPLVGSQPNQGKASFICCSGAVLQIGSASHAVGCHIFRLCQ
jgi:hypothetical protein